jgi:O-Antigen ligase
VIWLFMITPFVRRVADYYAGYQEASLIVLAPLLAAAISLYMLVKKLPLLYSLPFIPFMLVLAACLYGYFVGVINSGLLPASYDLLLWIVPLAFGFAIASDWRSFPLYEQSIFRTFLWGGAIIGAYGIYQYFEITPWDAYWMRNTQITSIGLPFPYQVRVFGTMNSPVAYSATLLPTLLIVLVSRAWSRYPAAVLGLGGFALSIVRTAWLGWIIGLGVLTLKLRGARRIRLAGGIMAVVLLALPVLTSGTIGERFAERLSTFGDIEEDKSFQARSELYDTLTEQALTNVLGTGTGAVGVSTKLGSSTQKVAFNIDSGLLFVPYTLGWPGALLMLVGVTALMLRPPGVIDGRNEVAVQTSNAICFALIAMMISYNSMYGVGGMIFWTFMGLRFSGRLWSANR